jgi:hypothetical protein
MQQAMVDRYLNVGESPSGKCSIGRGCAHALPSIAIDHESGGARHVWSVGVVEGNGPSTLGQYMGGDVEKMHCLIIIDVVQETLCHNDIETTEFRRIEVVDAADEESSASVTVASTGRIYVGLAQIETRVVDTREVIDQSTGAASDIENAQPWPQLDVCLDQLARNSRRSEDLLERPVHGWMREDRAYAACRLCHGISCFEGTPCPSRRVGGTLRDG